MKKNILISTFVFVVQKAKAIAAITIGFSLMVSSSMAYCTISDLFGNFVTDIGKVSTQGLFLIGIIGLFTTIFGFIELQKAKKTNGDKSIAYGMLITGVCLGLGPIIYANMAETVSGEKYEVQSDADFN